MASATTYRATRRDRRTVKEYIGKGPAAELARDDAMDFPIANLMDQDAR